VFSQPICRGSSSPPAWRSCPSCRSADLTGSTGARELLTGCRW
jgi:hypothetical protein